MANLVLVSDRSAGVKKRLHTLGVSTCSCTMESGLVVLQEKPDERSFMKRKKKAEEGEGRHTGWTGMSHEGSPPVCTAALDGQSRRPLL